MRPPSAPRLIFSRRRLWLSRLLVIAGGVSAVAGVAFIFWPAALIIGGVLSVAAGALGVPVARLDLDDDEVISGG